MGRHPLSSPSPPSVSVIWKATGNVATIRGGVHTWNRQAANQIGACEHEVGNMLRVPYPTGRKDRVVRYVINRCLVYAKLCSRRYIYRIVLGHHTPFSFPEMTGLLIWSSMVT